MSTTKKESSGTARKAFTPRPTASKEEKLPKLYRALTDQVDDGYYGNAIKTCKKILALDPSSQAAFQTLLFLNLQTDDYTSALALLSDRPLSASENMGFERAYCLYRLHREDEALAVLEGLSEKGEKVEHLEAQIRYRMGDYEQAQQIYDELLAACDPSSPEHPDILNNLSATTSHLEFTTHSYRAHMSDTASTSTSYVPNEADLESYVPSVPTGWSSGGLAATVQKKTAAVKPSAEKVRTKPKHKLPKGAVAGKAFTADPDRWLPLRQRASYAAAQSRKKGAKESMGTGFTQGSTAAGGSGRNTPSAAGGGGGGGKNKKGKRK